MAKLAIIFICAFLMVQYAAAGVVKRDAPAPNANQGQQELEKTLGQMQEFFKNTFSPEQLEKFAADLKQFGDTITTKGKDLIDQASESINKMKTQQ